MALVAETADHEILAVGRLTKIHGTKEAEVAVLVSDKCHGRGLGKELLARLLIVGADEKLTRLSADILPDNRDVMRICEKLGFSIKHSLEDDVVRAEFTL
jgi:acetyltransferase